MVSLFNDIDFFNELKPQDIEIINGQPKLNCNNQKPGLCTIYRDTCPHCVNMRDTFNNLSNILPIQDFYISGMNTNNPNTHDIVRQLQVQYVPKTYIVNTKGEMTEFDGDSHSEIELSQI